VPDDEAIVTSTNRGEAVVYDQGSPAGRAFLNVARRLNGEEVPFMAITDQPGVLERLLGMFGRRRS
ncbi:MAG: septum site-determining protein MinD, partial [Oscillochloris sp.]|nr:septum site-determining protein MinD [Oscillochloris sp.]